MAYSYQTWNYGSVATAAKMQQLEDNVRDHTHASSGVNAQFGNNIGIGVAPSAWGSGIVALDFGTRGAIDLRSNAVEMTNNARHDGTVYKYKTTGAAALIQITAAGDLFYYAAPSGTAGDTVTFNGHISVPNVASATNYLELNAGASASPTIDAEGASANINVTIRPKGLGSFVVVPDSGGVISFAAAPTGVSDVNYLKVVSSPTGTAASLQVVSGGTNKDLELTPASGGAVVPTTGQIRFPATQNPSSNANTLDDYEEGTWTPSVGGTATYTQQAGRYTKIGNKVFVECHLIINVIGTGSTSIITGLPFAANASAPNGTCHVSYFSLSMSIIYVTGDVDAGGSQIRFYSNTAAASIPTQNGIFGNSSQIKFSGHYTV